MIHGVQPLWQPSLHGADEQYAGACRDLSQHTNNNQACSTVHGILAVDAQPPNTLAATGAPPHSRWARASMPRQRNTVYTTCTKQTPQLTHPAVCCTRTALPHRGLHGPLRKPRRQALTGSTCPQVDNQLQQNQSAFDQTRHTRARTHNSSLRSDSPWGAQGGASNTHRCKESNQPLHVLPLPTQDHVSCRGMPTSKSLAQDCCASQQHDNNAECLGAAAPTWFPGGTWGYSQSWTQAPA